MDINKIRKSKSRLVHKSWDELDENVVELLRNRILEVERRERERGLVESVYNEEYKRWRTGMMLRYLKEKNKTETENNSMI